MIRVHPAHLWFQWHLRSLAAEFFVLGIWTPTFASSGVTWRAFLLSSLPSEPTHLPATQPTTQSAV